MKANTDVHLWSPDESDPYAPRLHVTAGGGLGINVGGMVIVKTLEEWHALAAKEVPAPLPKEYADESY